MVYIAETSTETVPNSSPSAASTSTDLYGMAVKVGVAKDDANVFQHFEIASINGCCSNGDV